MSQAKIGKQFTDYTRDFKAGEKLPANYANTLQDFINPSNWQVTGERTAGRLQANDSSIELIVNLSVAENISFKVDASEDAGKASVTGGLILRGANIIVDVADIELDLSATTHSQEEPIHIYLEFDLNENTALISFTTADVESDNDHFRVLLSDVFLSDDIMVLKRIHHLGSLILAETLTEQF
jgi:hypothetical protein